MEFLTKFLKRCTKSTLHFIDFFQDLATLLKSLYDAVGSSIKLPEAGAKTLKLRLSVTGQRQATGRHQQNRLQGQPSPGQQQPETHEKQRQQQTYHKRDD